MQLNSIRGFGLLLASINGLYAAYITAKYGDDQCSNAFYNTSVAVSEGPLYNESATGGYERFSYGDFYALIWANLNVVLLGKLCLN